MEPLLKDEIEAWKEAFAQIEREYREMITPTSSSLFVDAARNDGGAEYLGKRDFFKNIGKGAQSSVEAEL